MKLVLLVALVGFSSAASVPGGQTTSLEEGGIPFYIDNRSEDTTEVFSDGNGVTVVVGSAENAGKNSFTTPWGEVTLVNGGSGSLNLNYNPESVNIYVGLADKQVVVSDHVAKSEAEFEKSASASSEEQ